MRVLITWGSKQGRTTDIAEQIAHVLREQGHDIHARPAEVAPPPRGFDAVIIGSGLYANRWAKPARRYLERHVDELRRVPTWLFTSGLLEDSGGALSPPRDVRGLMARIGAIDHVTFGHRPSELSAAWALQIAEELPHARPRPLEPMHGRTIHRIIEYGTAGWAITAVLTLLAHASPRGSVIVHALVSPAVFGLLAHRYQVADGARPPAITALVWTLMFAVLDFFLLSPFIRPHYVQGIGVPLVLVFFSSWVVGAITRMTPSAQPFRRSVT